jgi:hypothetical protein
MEFAGFVGERRGPGVQPGRLEVEEEITRG